MHILIVLRSDASQRHGGDVVLARGTAAALRADGLNVDVVETKNPDPRGYDLAHLFNVTVVDECERQMDACLRAGVPAVLSTVWLDLREFFGRARACDRVLLGGARPGRLRTKLEGMAQQPADRFFGTTARRKLERQEARQAQVCRAARVLLPNSAIEARDCLVRLGVRDVPIIIVPIPADLEPSSAWQAKRHGLACVGRVETRKNQAMLALALRDEACEIDIVGASYESEYAAACRRLCPRARLLGSLPRRDVLALLGRAEVHAMVSWIETAGIANLEAAAAGAKLVVGDRGAEVEYFGNDAEYADPADPASIRAAVRRALAKPPRTHGDSLDQRIRRLTWQEVTRKTREAYALALDR